MGLPWAVDALLSSTMNWVKVCWLGVALRIPVRAALAPSAEVPVYNGICSSTGVYNTSSTPANLPWNTYNYCNAPHVNAAHYEVPGNAPNATLVYLNALIRHHKVNGVVLPHNGGANDDEYRRGLRTTYILKRANSIKCRGTAPISFSSITEGARRTSFTRHTAHHGTLSLFRCGTGRAMRVSSRTKVFRTRSAMAKYVHPALASGFWLEWYGVQDFWSVYAHKLGFLDNVNEEDIFIRTSVVDRTYQVAGGILTGMDPAMASKTFPVLTQPSAVSSFF